VKCTGINNFRDGQLTCFEALSPSIALHFQVMKAARLCFFDWIEMYECKCKF
jgi:hypothetical protein